MIALNRSADFCRRHVLSRILPVRRSSTGHRPGVRGRGPMGKDRGDTEQWRFPAVKSTDREKLLVVAEMIKFNNHLYTLGGKEKEALLA